jgi:hypothetical protein
VTSALGALCPPWATRARADRVSSRASPALLLATNRPARVGLCGHCPSVRGSLPVHALCVLGASFERSGSSSSRTAVRRLAGAFPEARRARCSALAERCLRLWAAGLLGYLAFGFGLRRRWYGGRRNGPIQRRQLGGTRWRREYGRGGSGRRRRRQPGGSGRWRQQLGRPRHGRRRRWQR